MKTRHACILIVLVLGWTNVSRADEEFDRLRARLDEAMKRYHSQFESDAAQAGWRNRATKPDQQVLDRLNAIRGVQNSPWPGFQKEFSEYASAHRGTPEALEAWALTATMSPVLYSDDGYIDSAEATTAIERLCSDHVADPGIDAAMSIIRNRGRFMSFNARETFYKAVETGNKDPELIARARLARADLHLNPMLNGSMAMVVGGEVDAQRVAGEKAKAESILRGLAEEYPQTQAGRTAQARLFKQDRLQVGMKMPGLQGRDVSGKLIRLSQFRGSVVLVVFWKSSSKRSMAMLPELRKAARRFAGKQFTILGVNCEPSRQAYKEIIAKEGLPWLNIFDGDSAKGLIADALHIQSLPAVFLLDEKGTIRYQGSYSEQVEQTIKKLIEKLALTEDAAATQPSD